MVPYSSNILTLLIVMLDSNNSGPSQGTVVINDRPICLKYAEYESDR